MLNTKIEFKPEIQDLLIEIGSLLEKIEALPCKTPILLLRKENQIRTIFSTVKIEGNQLNFDEVTAIIEGKHVKGDNDQILEVKNALKLYGMIQKLNPLSEMDFLLAHRVLMKDLIEKSGQYRTVSVGIQSKGKIKTIFPSCKQVPDYCKNLFSYLESSRDNYLIKSSIAHYLIESIHPFIDGNGRIGRFWQTLFLSRYNTIFEYLPIENQILNIQQRYYDSLEVSQKSDDPTLFIHVILEVIKNSLLHALRMKYEKGRSSSDLRFQKAKNDFNGRDFSRRDYLALFTNLSESMATKDLKSFVSKGTLNKTGKISGTRYWFN